MKRINTVFVYALLLVISLTLSSCFIFKKHKTQTKSTTDSTAYDKTQSSLTKHQSEAWNNYLNNHDSSSSGVSFYATPNSIPFDSVSHDLINWVKIHTDGSIEAKGNIKEVVHKSGKQTTKKDLGNKQSQLAYKYINTKYHITKTNNITKTLTVERKSDVMAYVKIGVLLALVLLVWFKWEWIVQRVFGILYGILIAVKGWFTGFFH
jgi:Co/Zn/Cd efflux system component